MSPRQVALDSAKARVIAFYPNARAVQYNNGWQIEISRVVMRATPGLGMGATEAEAWEQSLRFLDDQLSP